MSDSDSDSVMLERPLHSELPKPPVPYIKGWRFTVQTHTPPARTLVTWNCHINDKKSKKERLQLDLIDRCLKHPPLPGQLGDNTVTLEIEDSFKTGDGHISQVFLVRLIGANPRIPNLPSDGVRLVAKVYDPLYIDYDLGCFNPFICVDQWYSHEANVYPVLSHLQGQGIPKFYGSYSLDLPVDSQRTRTVRLILIEHIKGITMSQANPESFSQPARQNILKSIVDVESSIHKDFLLRDFKPRNIIIESPGSDLPRAVLIDFASVYFDRLPDDPHTFAFRHKLFLGEYISPLLRWTQRKGLPRTFAEWIDWEWDSWLEKEFAHTATAITPEMRQAYTPRNNDDNNKNGSDHGDNHNNHDDN
ncbi:uncharacterized protein N7459_004025 [Penicillium hispanicum]|uniref:uncharacterized protein n=1 Tax=Penicillium hispanicum TaxID=1080232 RepID=UPI0025406E84|nr:uncharacterized protein N7459_004025 [Penicillium hispanicum]KAJ5584225.1 hypothetical protein N7459_004025 [Penicillium hispanicum]